VVDTDQVHEGDKNADIAIGKDHFFFTEGPEQRLPPVPSLQPERRPTSRPSLRARLGQWQAYQRMDWPWLSSAMRSRRRAQRPSSNRRGVARERLPGFMANVPQWQWARTLPRSSSEELHRFLGTHVVGRWS